jgi:hypothetical protein
METPSVIMRQKNYKTKRQGNGRIDGGNKKEQITQCGLCTRGMENQIKEVEIGLKTKLLIFL